MTDQFRARRNVSALIRTASPEVKERTIGKLAELLRHPGMPIERVNFVLQILLETRDAVAGQPRMPPLLVQSLRGVTVDAQARIHDTLKFLAEYCKAPIGDELGGWTPASDGDSAVKLEQRIRRWQDYWAKPCEARS